MYKYNSVAGLYQHVNFLVINWISSRYKLAVKTSQHRCTGLSCPPQGGQDTMWYLVPGDTLSRGRMSHLGLSCPWGQDTVGMVSCPRGHFTQKLVKAVYNKAINEQREYRPESALFICNKWDLV